MNIVVFGLWHWEVSSHISQSACLTSGLIWATTAANIFFNFGNLPKLNKGSNPRGAINNRAARVLVEQPSLASLSNRAPSCTIFNSLLMVNDREVIISLNSIAKPPHSYKHSHAWQTFKDVGDCLGTWRLQLQASQAEMHSEGNENYLKTQDFKTSDSAIRGTEFIKM